MTTPVTPNPTLQPATHVIAEFTDYAEAQALVDRLSDAKFDVSKLQIVGRGLHTVENVQGRLTTGRAAGLGALSGAWMGLFFGVLWAILSPGVWFTPLLWAVLLGAVFGAIWGAVGQALTGGRRDFLSTKAMTADTYSVLVDAQHAAEATRLLHA